MMNRRKFFKIGALTAMATASAAHAVPVDQPENWTKEYDIVVVGAGGAGLACAVEGTERGLSVLVLEKMPFIGGASAICGGQYSAANTPFQQAKGIKDDDEHFLQNMLDIGGHVNDPELIKAYIKESLIHFNWLADHGVHPSIVYAPSGMDIPRAHRFDPAEVINCMYQYVLNKGAEVLTSTPAERLVWSERDKKICGVKEPLHKYATEEGFCDIISILTKWMNYADHTTGFL